MTPRKPDVPRARRRKSAAVVTIHDVAERAGVSVATVSRVLNQKDVVRAETSDQVLEAARSLRYAPNVAARALSMRRNHTIGIVLPEMHGEFFSDVIRGIDVAARRAGYHILVSGSHSDAAETLEVLAAMKGRVDGLVVMAPEIAAEALTERLAGDVPLVLLNSAGRRQHAITIDNYGGARAMMAHLFALGHRRIGFVTGPARNADARERLRGYRDAMRGAGLAAIEVRGDFSETSGQHAAWQLLESTPLPTATFAANDSMAIGALATFADAGLDVPREMTVVGFDDIRIARYVTPQLTTVAVDTAELGRRAFAVLLDLVDHPHARTERRERVNTRLVVRRSCAVPHEVKPTSQRPTRTLRGPRKGEV